MHDEAITVLLRQIDLLYYMRTSGDRAEMRRVLRALIKSVRVLSTVEDCPDEHDIHTGRHQSPRDCTANRRHEAIRLALHQERVRVKLRERRAELAAMADREVAEIANRPIESFQSGAAIAMYMEIREEAERRGLIMPARRGLRVRLPD